MILHEPLLRSELPKQEPDRVYGLQATQNFDDLLSKPMASTSADNQGYSVGECIRSSPFKEGTEPLLFPFLVLEAKAEKSSNGFVDIQTQTMFPIRALLKLQEDLQDEMIDTTENDLGPLVWFFANRGDSWRVYGCYVTDDKPPHYVSMNDLFRNIPTPSKYPSCSKLMVYRTLSSFGTDAYYQRMPRCNSYLLSTTYLTGRETFTAHPSCGS